uniref:MULE transposase domain-containing protein n=1 Tax=Fagus sylvatica TaxID=28930 RepID=A0A2N9H1Q0_FAGSY
MADKSKGKGKETGTSNKRSKLPIIGGKNKNRGIKITDRQPSVKGKEKEVANRSKGKGKEKMFVVSVEKGYDADDDVDCGDFDNDNEAGLEVEDEDFELDLWDDLLSGDEDLLDTAVATTDEEKGPKPKSVEFDMVDMSNPVLENGMKFADVYQFKETVREYNLKKGKDLSFVKNGKDKLQGLVLKKRCRQLIGLDGCFLKGLYRGHLLSVVARDANDNMYPICVAVVESKCKASWSWFLSTLLKNIGEVTCEWTFISDRQKGLTESFKEVCPKIDHRACVRHISANFKDSGHRGKALKDKLWAAASAYIVFEFDAHMAKLKKLSPQAYDYLSKIPDMPILTMLDTIRRKLMRRFQVNRASIAKMSGKLCPKIQVKVDKAGVNASEYLLLYSGEGIVANACGGSGSAGGVSGSAVGRGNGATRTGSAVRGNGPSKFKWRWCK